MHFCKTIIKWQQKEEQLKEKQLKELLLREQQKEEPRESQPRELPAEEGRFSVFSKEIPRGTLDRGISFCVKNVLVVLKFLDNVFFR